jgi:hypothetical protein
MKLIGLALSDPNEFSFEHFMNWVENLRLNFFKNTDQSVN